MISPRRRIGARGQSFAETRERRETTQNAREAGVTKEKLAAAHSGTVVGATFNDASDDASAFEREFKITYPSLRDVGTDLAHEFGTNKLPESFVLDRQGRVVAVSRGQLSQKFLDRALAEAQRAGSAS